MGDEILRYSIEANLKDFNTKMDELQKSIKDLGDTSSDSFGKAGTSFETMTASFLSAEAIQKVFEKLNDFVKECTKSFDDNIVTLAQLRQMLGDAATEELEAYAKAQAGVTRYSKEEILASEKILATHHLNKEEILKLMPVILDYGTKVGSATQTAQSFSYAIEYQTTRGLRPFGIEVDKTGSKQAIFNELFKQGQGAIKGQAEEMAKLGMGPAVVLTNKMHEMQEEIGGKLIPYVIKLEEAFKDKVLPVIEDFINHLDEWLPRIKTAGEILLVVFGVQKMAAVAGGLTAIATALSGIAVAGEAAAASQGLLKVASMLGIGGGVVGLAVGGTALVTAGAYYGVKSIADSGERANDAQQSARTRLFETAVQQGHKDEILAQYKQFNELIAQAQEELKKGYQPGEDKFAKLKEQADVIAKALHQNYGLDLNDEGGGRQRSLELINSLTQPTASGKKVGAYDPNDPRTWGSGKDRVAPGSAPGLDDKTKAGPPKESHLFEQQLKQQENALKEAVDKIEAEYKRAEAAGTLSNRAIIDSFEQRKRKIEAATKKEAAEIRAKAADEKDPEKKLALENKAKDLEIAAAKEILDLDLKKGKALKDLADLKEHMLGLDQKAAELVKKSQIEADAAGHKKGSPLDNYVAENMAPIKLQHQSEVNDLDKMIADKKEKNQNYRDLELAKIKLLENQKRSEEEYTAKFEDELRIKKLEQTSMMIGQIGEAANSLNDALGNQSIELFRIGQAASIAQVFFNTSIAIMKALAEMGPVAGPIEAAIIGIMGAAQVAKIVSQKPPEKPKEKFTAERGGIAYGPDHAAGGFDINIQGGESVLNRMATRALGPAAIHALNAGRFQGSPGGGVASKIEPKNTIVNFMDETLFKRYMASPEGKRAIVNTIGDQAFEVNGALSR